MCFILKDARATVMAKRSRVLTALTEALNLFPAPVPADSQPLATPAPGDLTPSSRLHEHLRSHAYIHAKTHIIKKY